MRGELGGWLETPRGTVALLLLLDQFTRNVFRGTSEAFSLIDSGRDEELPWVYRAFLHLPFEYSESIHDQRRCVERFGRFPHRNEVLDRESTPEEVEYLENAERYGQ